MVSQKKTKRRYSHKNKLNYGESRCINSSKNKFSGFNWYLHDEKSLYDIQ